MGIVFVALIVNVVLFGWVAGAIWHSKGGTFGAGFAWGAILGLLGLIYVAAAKPTPARSVATVSLPRSPGLPAPPGDAATPVAPAVPQAMRECPHCREAMRRDASVCPHCRRESDAWAFHDGRWWTRNHEGHEVFLLENTGRWMRPDDISPPPPTPPPPSLQWSRIRAAVDSGTMWTLGYLHDDRDDHYAVWNRSTMDEAARFPLTPEGWEQAFVDYWTREHSSSERAST